jgi:hypothetical protein
MMTNFVQISHQKHIRDMFYQFLIGYLKDLYDFNGKLLQKIELNT